MALWLRCGIVVLALVGVGAVAAPAPVPTPAPAPAPAQAPSGAPMALTALSQIETGLWQFEVDGKPPRQVCVSEPMALIQIEHDQPGCSRFVIANEPKSSTVHYSCQRAGWGRTTVRVETPRSASIQTQGIARNAPFDYTVQARRLGPCGAQTASRSR